MNKDIIYQEKYRGLNIEIYQDDINEGPDTWGDDGLFLVGYHRDFTVERDELITKQDLLNCYAKPEDLNEDECADVKRLRDEYYIFGLEAYIHSGVVLALSNEGNFCDRQWDVSQLGAVLVAKTEAESFESARELARGHIKTWNDYLSGNVYGYEVKTLDNEDVDSCWGFYGDYDAEYGALPEAKAVIDGLTNNGATDHKGQLLFAY